MFDGKEVTIQDMMNCRDRRSYYQIQFIQKYNCPVLSFTLNIPGPIKTDTRLLALFNDAQENIINVLKENNIQICDSVIFNDHTGYELMLCFKGDASFVKEKTMYIEENAPLGRLFDIDIIDTDGEKISRPVFRKCLICDCQAQDCARSRKHSIKEMQDKIETLLTEAEYTK